MSLLLQNNTPVNPAVLSSPFPHSIGGGELFSPNNGMQKTVKTVTHQTVSNPTVNQNGLDSFLTELDTPRKEPETHPRLKEKFQAEEKETKAVEEQKPETEQPETTQKHTPEFYKGKGQFAADVSDIVFPKGIALLNGAADETQYCAPAREKDTIAKAFARYFEETGKQMTPLGELAMALCISYGLPLGISLANKGMSLYTNMQEKRIKAKELEKEILIQQDRENRFGGNVPEQQPAPTEQPKNEPTPKPEPETPLEPIKKPESKTCKHDNCHKTFVKGTGHGKGKRTLYYDQFCSKGCMGQYTSRKALQKRKNNKTEKVKNV